MSLTYSENEINAIFLLFAINVFGNLKLPLNIAYSFSICFFILNFVYLTENFHFKLNSMKNFLFISLLFLSSTLFAQTNTATNMVATQDTVINSGTTSHVKLLQAHYQTVTVAVRITKVSGTVGGSAALQGSIDGTNYFAISGASNLTLTDVASQGTLWVTTNAPYSYYRVLTTGTGTMRATVSAKILPKK